MITAVILGCAATAAGPVTCENYVVKATAVTTIAECIFRLDAMVIPPLVSMGVEIKAAACKIDEEPADGADE